MSGYDDDYEIDADAELHDMRDNNPRCHMCGEIIMERGWKELPFGAPVCGACLSMWNGK